ncbi:hypothetical protein [Hymenobacter sp. 102]|uniref:hypothetical protein n=1 Tax=Hymenobacter sp. 102 TaxID=3403152 RepID=UPI003CFAA985
MRYFLIGLLASASLFGASSALAQRRFVSDLMVLPQVQAEYSLKGDDYVFAAFNLIPNIYSNTSVGSTFLGGEFRIGYEHLWNTSWSGGGRLFASSLEYEQLEPELFVRHWNAFGSVNFRQRLGLRYRIPLSGPEERALAGLRLDVDRIFPLGSSGLALRPRIAVEPVAYLRFQREDYEAKEPFLDFSELRGEVSVRLSPRFDFTPWVAWQNSYFIGQPQFNPDGSVKIPGGNGRIVQPVLGLDMRVTLGQRATDTSRRQLPTQY